MLYSSKTQEIELLSNEKRPVVSIVLLMLVLSALFVTGVTGLEIWHARQNALDDARLATRNMARVLALHAEATMKTAALILDDIVERVERDGIDADSRARLTAHLQSAQADAAVLQGLFAFDTDGNYVASSLPPRQGNISDRAYFNYHRTHADRSLHIGMPIRSKSTGDWVIPISRRLDRPDGSFAGVALASLRVDFFESAYSKLEVGQTGTIIFASDTGILYYRRPFAHTPIGLDVSNGPLMKAYHERGPSAP